MNDQNVTIKVKPDTDKEIKSLTVNDQKIDVRELFEMKQKGVDKCILHSRKGTEVEYLSEEWFEKIGFILEECEKLSIEVLVYDEDNWPSGYAGGRLTSENPSFAATCLSVEKVYPVLGEYITVEDIPVKKPERRDGIFLGRVFKLSFIEFFHMSALYAVGRRKSVLKRLLEYRVDDKNGNHCDYKRSR